MELFQFLTDTTQGKMLLTMLVSMIPVIELRGSPPLSSSSTSGGSLG